MANTPCTAISSGGYINVMESNVISLSLVARAKAAGSTFSCWLSWRSKCCSHFKFPTESGKALRWLDDAFNTCNLSNCPIESGSRFNRFELTFNTCKVIKKLTTSNRTRMERCIFATVFFAIQNTTPPSFFIYSWHYSTSITHATKDSSNYQGISQLSTTYKIQFNILSSKLTQHFNETAVNISTEFDINDPVSHILQSSNNGQNMKGTKGLSVRYLLTSTKPMIQLGTAVTQWLKRCVTNPKVTGSIPDGVIGIFHWRNPSGCTMALRSTRPLTETHTKRISWG